MYRAGVQVDIRCGLSYLRQITDSPGMALIDKLRGLIHHRVKVHGQIDMLMIYPKSKSDTLSDREVTILRHIEHGKEAI